MIHTVKKTLTIILLAAYAGLSLGTMFQKSATWDETHYLGLGHSLLMERDWDMPSATLHPPLSYYLHSLPLLFFKLDQSCFEKGRSSDILSGVRRGQCLMRNSSPSGDTLLCLARAPMIGIGILLGWFVYLWASALYGTTGGLLSLFLYCLSPNILAHSGLITPDLCLTAFGFMSVYFFWRNTRSPSVRDLVLAGLALGLTLLSKYAGLLWVPILALLAVVESMRSKQSPESRRGFSGAGPIIHLGVVVFLAFVVLFLGYQLDVSAYFTGMEEQRRIVGEGFPAFLNGQVSRNGGWWYYYLFALLIKVPIPSLVMIFAGFFAITALTTSERANVPWLITPVLLIVIAFSVLTQVNVGLRYVLPVFPFLMVIAGSTSLLLKKRKVLRGFLALALMAWYTGENLSIHPHYLAYFNQFVGGPRNGYCYLVDSNLDWGQDLKALRKYMDEEGIPKIKLSYFGTSDPDQYGISFEALPSFVPLHPFQGITKVRNGDLFAVSATNLYPLFVDLGPLGEYFRNNSPEDQIGHSILIYRMDRDFNAAQ